MADIFQPKGEKQGNAKKRSFDELALALFKYLTFQFCAVINLTVNY